MIGYISEEKMRLSVIIRKEINGCEGRFVFKRLVGFACEKRQVYDILRVARFSNKEKSFCY